MYKTWVRRRFNFPVLRWRDNDDELDSWNTELASPYEWISIAEEEKNNLFLANTLSFNSSVNAIIDPIRSWTLLFKMSS